MPRHLYPGFRKLPVASPTDKSKGSGADDEGEEEEEEEGKFKFFLISIHFLRVYVR